MRSVRAPSRALAMLCSTVVAAGLLAVAAPTAAHADSVVPLSIPRAHAMLAANDRIFISPGVGGSSILVTNFDGATVGTVPNQTGAMGMSASADGSKIYVALRGASAISVIDTTTLAEVTRYSTSVVGCPTQLVSLGSVLWFTYECANENAIGALDTAAETPTAVTAVQKFVRVIAGHHGAPDKLFTSNEDGTVYALSGTTATEVVSVRNPGGCANTQDARVSPDGSQVYLACGAPYQHLVLSMTDMTLVGSYGSNHPYPNAVAVSPAGDVAGGITWSYEQHLLVWTSGGTERLRVRYGDNENSLQGGLQWSPDGSRLFALSYNWATEGQVKLRIFIGPARAASSIALSAPSTAPLGARVTVTGTLSLEDGASPDGRTLTVSRRNYDATWTALPSVTTAPGGAFSFSNVPKGGPVTYAVKFLGDDDNKPVTAKRSLTVSRRTTTVTLARSTSLASYGRYVTLTAHLGAHHEVDVVSIYAKRYGATSWSLIKRGSVNSSGNLRASYKMTRRTAFRATFAGDDRYGPAAATTTVLCRSVTSITSVGHYGSSGGYRLFRSSVPPTFVAKVTPNKAEKYVTYVVQRYSSGAWRTLDSASFQLDATSRTAASFYGARIGAPYRAMVKYGGDTANTRSASRWVYFKVTG